MFFGVFAKFVWCSSIPSWTPFGAQIWSIFGAKLRPSWTKNRSKNQCKKIVKIYTHFGPILDQLGSNLGPKLVAKGGHKGSKKMSETQPCFHTPTWPQLGSILDPFWSILAPTWLQKWSKNVPNLRSKWCPRGYRRASGEFNKNLKKPLVFSMILGCIWTQLGLILDPFW